jgi:5-methylcytosine-specific restriction endonuclease McrA
MTTTTEHSPEYVAHLASPEWQLIRKDKLERAGYRCERCGVSMNAGYTLDIHHLTYERLGDELPEDLLVVCRPCHKIEDAKRAERTQDRIWESRVEGYARRRWGEQWYLDREWHEAEDALIEWLDVLGEE